MTKEKVKPAYKLRLEDLKPFVGPKRHAIRCWREAMMLEMTTGEYHGPESDYHIQSWARGFLLGLYNGTIVVGGMVGVFTGLSKILS